MIAVIADDFTGAAEIGGLALLYGYKTAIVTKVERIKNIDLLIIATEMRSMDFKEAAKESEEITRELLKLKPEFIYKKIDSVLRGNIVAEIESQLKVSKKIKALVIPANPNLKRTIRKGIYYVDNNPLIESKFADDLVFKARSSNVLDLIGKTGDLPITSNSHFDHLPENGLVIGNTLNMLDLNHWANILNDKILPSGAAGFFGAILDKKGEKIKNFDDSTYKDNKKALYICGSNFPLSKQAVIDARTNGHPVYVMPDEIYNNRIYDPIWIDKWAKDIIREYQNSNKVIVSVLQKPGLNSIRGKQIKIILGTLVQKIMEKEPIDELLIEGGSTAHLILEKLQIDTFYPIQSLAPGVTRMQTGNNKNLCLTMKPGSYIWPNSIWKFN